MNWWMETSPVREYDGIIADGAIRSGKTLSMALSFIMWSMDEYDGQNFVMAGNTIDSFRRNVLEPMKQMLPGRGYGYQDKRGDNLFIVRRNGRENYYYIFGGKDEGSRKLVQGITAAGALFDEVALMPESFVDQATARCSVDGSKFWFNCNPEGPDHWFKKEWVDKSTGYLQYVGKEAAEKLISNNTVNGMLPDLKQLVYLHFTMEDNLSLSEKIKARYRSQYSGVFYKRYIDGLWALAEGLIFRYLADDDTPYIFRDSDNYGTEENPRYEGNRSYSKTVMGVDFGGNKSKTTFVFCGYIGDYSEFRILKEAGLPLTDDIDAERICTKFISFYKECLEEYRHVDWVFPDSASKTMINSLRSSAREAKLPWNMIVGCRKNEVRDRPKTLDRLLTTGRLKIHERCIQVRKALASLVWDEDHPDIPEDKNIGNCNDWYDATCYCFLNFIERIDLDI